MHVMQKTALVCSLLALAGAARADVVRLAPMGRILVPDAEVRIVPTVFYPGWISRTPYGGYRPEADGSRRWRISEKWNYGDPNNGTNFLGRTSATVAPDGSLDVSVALETVVPCVTQISSVVCARLPVSRYAGGKVVLDGAREKALPVAYEKGKIGVFRETVRELALHDRNGACTLTFRFPKPTTCYVQDNREWKGSDGDVFTLRISFDGKGRAPQLVCGDSFAMDFNLKTPGPVAYSSGEHVIAEGADWVRIQAANDPVPGSALDFSQVVPHDAPAGKHGWLVVRNGHFEFENLPGVKQRFYGVNFVGESNYPPAKDADRFVANLARIGYNAVRFHHHDNGIADSRGALKPEKMARFDAMVAACIKYGVYMTTDLYVSRPVPWRELGEDKPGNVGGSFKMLVRENDKAFSNLCAFAENWLTHVNPFTGRRWIDEPALAWISLVNENAADNYIKMDATELERQRDLENRFYARMTRFLREKLGAKQLLTDLNGFLNGYKMTDIWNVCRQSFDYVDMHFYVDHPYFLGQPWALPTECSNRLPFDDDRLRVVPNASYCRIPGKPFTITEWNFSAPGRYRGVGGIATGAWAAHENWDALWRFAWSHSVEGVMNPCGQRMGSFDLSGDPIARASERASLCLFLRGDLKPGQAEALKIDGQRGQMEVVTERTAGGFAKRGKIKAGIFAADVGETPTTVWASALDDRPLTTSRRILVTHLTDVQNTGARFGDESMKVSLKDGDLPHLMRRGRADVSLKLRPGAFAVYVLNEDGSRRGKIASRQSGGRLAFVADVGRDEGTVSYLYEIVRLKERQK